jgi:hypothetical protein
LLFSRQNSNNAENNIAFFTSNGQWILTPSLEKPKPLHESQSLCPNVLPLSVKADLKSSKVDSNITDSKMHQDTR